MMTESETVTTTYITQLNGGAQCSENGLFCFGVVVSIHRRPHYLENRFQKFAPGINGVLTCEQKWGGV